jgi:hypothetical protein
MTGQSGRRPRQVVFVTGEARIGKTALKEELERQVRPDRGIRVARRQCIEACEETEAYHPVLEPSGVCFARPAATPRPAHWQVSPADWLVQFPVS